MKINCAQCGRTFERAPEALARNRSCMYCGAAVEVPEGVALPDPAPVRGKNAAAARPVLVICPLCGNSGRVKAPPGAETSCKMCGYAFVVPEADGVGRFVPFTLAGAAPADYSCASCGQPFAYDGNRPAELHACVHCGHPHDFRGWSPDDLFGAFDSDRPRLQLAAALLRHSWCAGLLALGEARLAHDYLQRLAPWLAEAVQRNALSPLDPEITARIALRVFGGGTVRSGKSGEAHLSVMDALGSEDSRKIRMSNATYCQKLAAASAAKEIGGEFGLVGALIGAAVTSSTSRQGSLPAPEDPISVRTAFLFAAGPDGTTGVPRAHDCPQETYLTIPEDVGRLHEAKLMSRLRKGFGAAAESYVVFRLLFGPRVQPEMMAMAKSELIEQCVAGRLEALLPHAAEIAAAIHGDLRATGALPEGFR